MDMHALPLTLFLLTALPCPHPHPHSHPHSHPHREMLPHPSVYRMAGDARAVVEGTVGERGAVTVTRRFFVADGETIGATIRVPSLVDMPLREPAIGGGQNRLIEPDRVLLFLGERVRGDEWVPLQLHQGVARGVLWFDDDEAWGYGQWVVPGRYVLRRWYHGHGREQVAATPTSVRERVARAVDARAKWRATLAIEDPQRRAGELVKWFSPSTSPDGDDWLERIWPDLMQASDAVGAPMVEPLAQIVRVGETPHAVATAADALARLGPTARPAAPSVIARLRALRGAEPIFLVRCLRRLADRRAQAVLRDLMDHDDAFVVAEAAMALHASGGEGVAELLAARIPESTATPEQRGAVASMLELLHNLDPAVAERLVVARYLDDEQLMMQRPWLRRLRRR